MIGASRITESRPDASVLLLDQFLLAESLERARSLPGAEEWNLDDHNFLETRLQRELLMRRELEVFSVISSVRSSPAERLTAESGRPRERELRDRLAAIFRSKPLIRDAWALSAEEKRLADAGEIVEALAAARRLRALREEIQTLDPRATILIGM